jgi:lipoprotein NlpI
MAQMRMSTPLIAAGLMVASPALAVDQHDGRSSAFSVAADVAGAASPFIQMVRLDAKDPDTHRNRGTKDQAKAPSTDDLYQMIGYYNASIRRDPKDDDAYFHRGLAKLYAGALPAAISDLSQASRIDPQYAYYALWIDIIDKRLNEASSLAQAAAHFNMSKWPAPVVRLFLGDATPADVLAAANDPDPVTRTGQLCEANFYNGEFALQQGDKQEAARLFRLAAAGCSHEFVEGASANSELAALEGSQ